MTHDPNQTLDDETAITLLDRHYHKTFTATDPANRFDVVQTICSLYRDANYQPPRFIWYDNPLAMCMDAMIIDQIGADDVSAGHGNLLSSVLDITATQAQSAAHWRMMDLSATNALFRHRIPQWCTLQDTLCQMIKQRFWEQFRMTNDILSRIVDAILAGSNPWLVTRTLSSNSSTACQQINQLKYKLQTSLREGRFRVRLDQIIEHILYGSIGNAFYEYDLLRQLGLINNTIRQRDAWELLAKNCLCWLPFRDVCLLCERPVSLKMSDSPFQQQQLHCEDGPAIAFSDGTCFYCFNGVIVNEQIIMSPQTQSLVDIRNEMNADVKRIRIERFGWVRYLSRCHAYVIEHKRNDISQTEESLMQLYQMRVLVCACPSTARIYAMQVPKSCKTVDEAQHYLSHGLNKRLIGAS